MVSTALNGRIVYAVGAKLVADLHLVNKLGDGKVAFTYGNALNNFGGKMVKFADPIEKS